MNTKRVTMLSAAAMLSLSVSAGRLPAGFTELDYVEASGDQPVVTEYVPKGSTSIKARLALTKLDSQAVFCARGMESKRTFSMFWIADKGLRWDYGALEDAYREVYDKSKISAGDPFALEIRGNEVYLRGSRTPSSISHASQEDYKAENALVLFACYNENEGGLSSATEFKSTGYVRLYSLTATEGDKVVLELIPCLNQDKVVGLYDTVSGSFMVSCKSPLKEGNDISKMVTLTIGSDIDGAVCRPGVGDVQVVPGVPMMASADSSVTPLLTTITPIGWELTVTPAEGDSYTVKNNSANARCCDYTPKEGDVLSLNWHYAETKHYEKLPVGYTRLEYVKTTGSQYLLTDYTPTGKTCVDMVMRDATGDWTGAVFCSRGADSSRNSYTLFLIKGALRWDYGAKDAVDPDVSWMFGDGRVRVSIRGNNVFIGSRLTDVSKPNRSDYTAGNKLALFAAYATEQPPEPTDFSSYAKMELSLFRVMEDGLLVRQYLPCRRDADNAVGLYETVTGKFLLPSGDPLVAGEKFDGSMTLGFISVRAKGGETVLPSDYAAVDYVEATGSQYVVTEYTPTGNSAFSAKLDIKENTPMGIFCARGADGVNPYTLFYTSNGPTTGLRWDYAKTDGAAVTPVDIGLCELQGLQNEFYINCVKDAITSKSAPASFTAGNKLVLFASYSAATLDESTVFSNLAKIRLYSFAIAEGDELQMNLLPCRRVADGTVGLYDAVNKEFYSSSSGVPLVSGTPRVASGTLTVVGNGGELGNPTFPYGVSADLKAGDSFVCEVQQKAASANGTLSCLGYQLETNDLNGAWIPWKSGGANSFVYEHPENTNVRLTWKWGMRGLSIFFY